MAWRPVRPFGGRLFGLEAGATFWGSAFWLEAGGMTSRDLETSRDLKNSAKERSKDFEGPKDFEG